MKTIQPESDVLEQIRDARWRQSNQGLSRQAYGRWHRAQLKAMPGPGAQRSVVLTDGPSQASAERYDLAGVLDGRQVRVCAVADILGDGPEGRGTARRLIEAIVADAAADGAEVALLFDPTDLRGRTEHDVLLQPTELTLRVTESPRHGAPMTTVRVGEERDLSAIVAMGRHRAEPFRFHLDRDTAFVRYAITRKRLLGGLGPADARQLHFFIAEEGITAAAYVVMSVTGNEWILEECGDRDESGARVGALLQALIAREPARRRPTIRAWLPAGFLPPQVTIASTASSTDTLVVRMIGAASGHALRPDEVLYWRNDLL